jgi:hypothetical protein
VTWVGDALFVLPGRNVPLFPGKGEDEEMHGGAVWRHGGWHSMSEVGAPAVTPNDWGQTLAGEAGGQLVVRAGGAWARYDPTVDAWSAASSAGAPASSDQALRAGRRLLVAGASDAAAYDPARDRWAPVPLPPLVGGAVLYRVDAERFVLLDPPRGTAALLDLSVGVQRRSLDARGLPDRRSFERNIWTGRCLVAWGGVSYHPVSGSCAGADRPCDPAVDIERDDRGVLWCPDLR